MLPPHIVGIIQARMGSTRLPGKVMKPLGNRVILDWVVSRVRAASLIDHVVVATTSEREDDRIEAWCRDQEVECIRGPVDDVLARFNTAAEETDAEVIARFTADCPLLDPVIIDEVVQAFLDRPEVDYAATGENYPEGFGVEVFSREVLGCAHREAERESDREHVTPYIWRNEHRFGIYRLNPDQDLSAYRLTLDYPTDLEVLGEVIERSTSREGMIGLREAVEVLRSDPKLAKRNSGIPYQEGYQESLRDPNS